MSMPLFIGPEELGVQTNLKPFMLPEKAFAEMTNAYQFRGRVERKRGFTLLNRLERNLSAQSLGTTGASPWTFNIYSTLAVPITGEPDAAVIPNSVTINLNAGANIFTDSPQNGTLLRNGVQTVPPSTINYATGAVTLVHTVGVGVAATISFSYYPALPVMGLRTQEVLSQINQELTIAFDTKYAYGFNYATKRWNELVPGTTWTGLNYAYFWTTNYWTIGGNNLFWAVNYTQTDPIRYYNGTAWTNFTPLLNSIPASDQRNLQNCLVLVPYKGFLIAFNTIESVTTIGTSYTNYRQRARWSQQGDPTDATNAWVDDVPGRGGYQDAATNESIVSVGFIKDQLIVYFERSTWQLVSTGNSTLPFFWQRINASLGSNSTFSSITFDSGLLTFGNVGIHTCDGISVRRIDEIIPDTVFNLQQANAGVNRIYGIRDFFREFAYWTYPDGNNRNVTFPNRVLAFNYRSQTWSFFEESFTCYGYFQASYGLTWATLPFDTWDEWTQPWNSSLQQEGALQICAGNQQGFVFQLSYDSPEVDVSLQIKGLVASSTPLQTTITSPNHNLKTGDIVYLTRSIGVTNLNNSAYEIRSVSDNTFDISGTPVGTYVGGGLITVLRGINVKTKMFNPFWQTGTTYRLVRIEYLLDRTPEGEITADVYNSMNQSISCNDPSSNAMLGSNALPTTPSVFVPFQAQQDQIWQRQFYNISGDTFQIGLTISPSQLQDIDLANSEVILHGMVLHFDKAGDFN